VKRLVPLVSALLVLPACHHGGTREASGGVASSDNGFMGGCRASWLAPPMVDPSIEVPLGGGGVLLHVRAGGTQNYTCTRSSDGGTSWTLTGPSALLVDCNGQVVGRHQASDAGAGFPEWIEPDGTLVVAHKIAMFVPSDGARSAPWLLLKAVGYAGNGTLSHVSYVQRLDTDGGVGPALGCEAGETARAPYTADYYFYGR
jgi:hypothetical protein